ncbi:hypothetical protein [uncultured Tenacibaculum sp.]|uniref:hypothetical protein n=1 Tax=uncultured Tenacibaculum sp. TaxID=174713 RepID=UPI002601CD9E|nr:hypothetical protein [uncultured Tenacibaculum sp.]
MKLMRSFIFLLKRLPVFSEQEKYSNAYSSSFETNFLPLNEKEKRLSLTRRGR